MSLVDLHQRFQKLLDGDNAESFGKPFGFISHNTAVRFRPPHPLTTKERIKKNKDLLIKYQYMLKKANEWQPPTSDHIKLKDFMIQQISESIKHDCYYDDKYIQNNMPKQLTGNEWIQKHVNMKLINIEDIILKTNDKI